MMASLPVGSQVIYRSRCAESASLDGQVGTIVCNDAFPLGKGGLFDYPSMVHIRFPSCSVYGYLSENRKTR